MNNPRILFENSNLAVLNKPANLLVHSTPNSNQPTLVNFIIKKWPQIKKYNWPADASLSAVNLPRRQAGLVKTGIIHRLDKDTSGLILIAKNPKTLKFLQNQFKDKTIKKEYILLCLGKTKDRGEIKTQTTRHPKQYNKQKTSLMSFSWQKGKSRTAVTKYITQKYYKFEGQVLSLIKARIITGRTHQIRNHFKFINHPVIGDQMYFTKKSQAISDSLGLKRQFLHSSIIEFKLPNGSIKKIKSCLPAKLNQILSKLDR